MAGGEATQHPDDVSTTEEASPAENQEMSWLKESRKPLWNLLEDVMTASEEASTSTSPESPSAEFGALQCCVEPAKKKARHGHDIETKKSEGAGHAEHEEEVGPLTWARVLKDGFGLPLKMYLEKQKRVRLQTACSGTGCAAWSLKVHHGRQAYA